MIITQPPGTAGGQPNAPKTLPPLAREAVLRLGRNLSTAVEQAGEQGALFEAPARPAKRARIKVRQNPPTATPTGPGEQCPLHGWYERPYGVNVLTDQAVGHPGVDPAKARHLLEQADKLRRTCPECGGIRPADRAWAAQLAGGAQ